MKKEHTKFPKKILQLILIFMTIGFNQAVLADNYFQDKIIKSVDYLKFKGKVIDSNTKKPLALATLLVEETNISTVTNSEGDFILKVPKGNINKTVTISSLGYQTKHIPLLELKEKNNRITLFISVTELEEVDIKIPADATTLVDEVFENVKENYFNTPTIMTAFYRETIKKRRKNVSLAEAIVNIYKSSYNSVGNDHLELYKSRKSTNYKRLDTLVLKLQGGPFNTLFIDIMKYPEYVFDNGKINDYNFTYEYSTTINNKQVSVISFEQKNNIADPLYKGNLFIDAKNKVLISANYSLNITNKKQASEIFIRKKPGRANVWPTKIIYNVNYREKDGRWYYGYSNAFLEFKIDWANKLFNSTYSMVAEMAITDWKNNSEKTKLKQRDKLKRSIIFSNKTAGFYDAEFWGKHNIIEPEKSIESAIKKIKKQLQKSKS